MLAPKGGTSLDVSGMDRILAIHAEDMDCVVQCGVTRQRLNEELRATGLFFPVDLGAQATLGGMASTRASGTTTVRYGSMRELVLGLTVVLPGRSGDPHRRTGAQVRGRLRPDPSVRGRGRHGGHHGADAALFGTPEAAQSLLCSFPDLDAATACVVAAQHCGLGLTRIELADDLQMAAINAWCAAALPETATLWVEITGSDPAVGHDVALFQDLARDAGATRIEPAATAEDATRLWRIRHEALYANRRAAAGHQGHLDRRLRAAVTPAGLHRRHQDRDRSNRPCRAADRPCRDGNFHLVLLFDPAHPQETETARTINRRLVELALSMGGTSTGEHGVGLGKQSLCRAWSRAGPDAAAQRRGPTRHHEPRQIFDLLTHEAPQCHPNP